MISPQRVPLLVMIIMLRENKCPCVRYACDLYALISREKTSQQPSRWLVKEC